MRAMKCHYNTVKFDKITAVQGRIMGVGKILTRQFKSKAKKEMVDLKLSGL